MFVFFIRFSFFSELGRVGSEEVGAFLSRFKGGGEEFVREVRKQRVIVDGTQNRLWEMVLQARYLVLKPII